MYILLSILIIIVCVLLVFVVLIQNPKGGGIASNFTSPTQIMGAKRSSDLVEKATWILAVVLIVFSLASNFMRPSIDTETDTPKSRIQENIENAPTPAAPQQAPAPAPAQQQTQPADGAAQPADGAATTTPAK
ncbi:MAG: preprotein translocase subunit SecG [Bacteroidota bacterium]